MSLPSLMADQNLEEQPKVLLVDDDEVNLLLTSIALRERGFAITEASSGEQALHLMADLLPDVVVRARRTGAGCPCGSAALPSQRPAQASKPCT